MALDFNEARLIIEEAKRRGMIRAAGEPPAQKETQTGESSGVVLPEWLQQGISKPAPRE